MPDKEYKEKSMFVYVMDIKAKELLESLGYELMKTNGSVWVFLNKANQNFESLGVPCVISDTLTF